MNLDFCDVRNTTSVDIDQEFNIPISLDHGETYYATVTAINGVGLSTVVSSSGITIDQTPPLIEGLSLDHVVLRNVTAGSRNTIRISRQAWSAKIRWSSVSDVESGIASFKICIGTNENNCEFQTWTSVNTADLYHVINFSQPLASGTVFIVTVKAQNGAGLDTTMHSALIIVDNTPPLPGNVTVATSDSLVFLQEGQQLHVAWHGFNDRESGVSYYEWKICLTSDTTQCLSDFVKVSNKTILFQPFSSYDYCCRCRLTV